MINAKECRYNLKKYAKKKIPFYEKLYTNLKKLFIKFKFEKDIERLSKKGYCGIHIPPELDDDIYRTHLEAKGFEVVNESIYRDRTGIWYCYWHKNHGRMGTWNTEIYER